MLNRKRLILIIFSLGIISVSMISGILEKNRQPTDEAFDAKSTIEKITLDNQDTFSAIRDNISNIIKQGGIIDAVKTVEVAFAQSKISYGDCHILLHLVGHQSYPYYSGNFKEIVKDQSNNVCSSAYIHGVEAEIIFEREDWVGQLKLLCDEANKTTDYTCYHGAGHALLELNSTQIQKALKLCEQLIGSEHDIQSCYTGIFSEYGNRASNFDGNTKKRIPGPPLVKIDRIQPLIFCQTLDTKYLEACVSQITKLVYDREDINRSIKSCQYDTYYPKTQEICTTYVGLQYGQDKLSTNQTIPAPQEASKLSGPLREKFITGVKSSFQVYTQGGAKRDYQSFCQSFPRDDDRIFCQQYGT